MAKVLIVDDEPEVRRALSNIVQEAGHETFEASDGPGALRQILTVHPDLVFLDWLIPELRGDVVLEKLRNDPEYSAFSDTIVVILTDFADDLLKQDFQRLGANHVLAKQDDLDRMKDQVHVAMLGLTSKDMT